MRECTHAFVDHLLPGWDFDPWGLGRARLRGVARCEQFRCNNCGAWLSLGPSPGTTHAEMQLAERLASIYRLWDPGAERMWREAVMVERWALEGES